MPEAINILNTDRWKAFVKAFIAEKRKLGHISRETEREYRYRLAISAQPARRGYVGRYAAKRLYPWLLENQICQPDLSDIREYLEYLRTKRHLTIKTVNKLTGIYRQFFEFLNDHGFYENKIKYLKAYKSKTGKQERHTRKAITADIFFPMLELMDKTDTKQARDRAILATLWTSGARIKSVITLQLRDFAYIRRDGIYELKFREWKKKEIKTSDQLPDIAAFEINNYLKLLKKDGVNLKATDPLFISLKPGANIDRLSVSAVSHIAKKYIRKLIDDGLLHESELHGFSAHSFRHGYITFLIDNGFDVKEAQEAGKHEHIDTTMIYIQERMKDMLLKRINEAFIQAAQRFKNKNLNDGKNSD